MNETLLKNGHLISITGGIKNGKTVLCNRVVGKDSFIKISGSQIDSREKFWQLIAEKLELPEEISISYATQSQDNHKTVLSAKAALPGLPKGAAGVKPIIQETDKPATFMHSFS